jgi:hypothetical protein
MPSRLADYPFGMVRPAQKCPRAAVFVASSGKSWRLIDGRKCWFDGYRYLPKSQLHWGPSKQATVKVSRPRKAIAKPVHPTGDSGSDQGKQEGTADDRYRAVGTGLTFSAMQDRADQLRAELTKPKLVRTVLVSPTELIDTPPDLVPLPTPRPKTAQSPPEPRTGLLTWWFPLLLAGIMLGTVSRTQARARAGFKFFTPAPQSGFHKT